MKTRKKIYIISGSVLIVLNLLIDLASLAENDFESEQTSFNIGYIIGHNFFLLIGVVLLRNAYKLHKKITQAAENESINAIGDNVA